MPATPAFRAAGATVASGNNVGNPTTLSPALPTRVTADTLICITASRSITATVATPSGWTPLAGFPIRSTTASGGTIYAFAEEVDGSETAPSIVWTGVTTGTSGDSSQAVVLSYSGLKLVGVQDVAVVKGSDAAVTTPIVLASQTTVSTNVLQIGVAMRINDTAHTFTGGFTNERVDAHTTSGTGFGLQITDVVRASAGATGTANVVPSATVSSRVLAASIALDPADTFQQPVADTLSVADAQLPAERGVQTVADDVVLVDDVVGREANFATVADDLVLVDDAVAKESNVINASADTLSVADAASASSGYSTSVPDAASVADAASPQSGKGTAVADTASVADAASPQSGKEASVPDTVSVLDSAATLAGFSSAAADTLSLTDSQRFDRGQSLADALGTESFESLPSGWTENLNGAAPASIVGNKLNVNASGDFWLNADLAHYYTRQIAGTGAWWAEVEVTETAQNTYARTFGARSSSSTDAAMVTSLHDGDRSHLTLVWRDDIAANANWAGENTGIARPSGAITYRLRIEVSSDRKTATMFASFDNGAWQQTGTHTVLQALDWIHLAATTQTTQYDNLITSDRPGITDTATPSQGWAIAAADTVTLADAIVAARAVQQALADNVSVADATAVARAIATALADTATVADAQSLQRNVVTALADALALNDALTPATGKEASVSDVLVLTDAPVTLVGRQRSVADALSVADLVVPLLSGSYIHHQPPLSGEYDHNADGLVVAVVADGMVSVYDAAGLVVSVNSAGEVVDARAAGVVADHATQGVVEPAADSGVGV